MKKRLKKNSADTQRPGIFLVMPPPLIKRLVNPIVEMNFPMTVGADRDALLDFFFEVLRASCGLEVVNRHLTFFRVVKLNRPWATIVPTDRTPPRLGFSQDRLLGQVVTTIAPCSRELIFFRISHKTPLQNFALEPANDAGIEASPCPHPPPRPAVTIE